MKAHEETTMNYREQQTGKRLAITSLLLLIPTAVLVYLYVGMLNRKVSESADALIGLKWASSLNDVRLAVLTTELASSDHYIQLEDAVEKLSNDMVATGIINTSETKKLRSAAKYRETGQFSEITWKLNLLQDINYGSEMLRHELGYAMGVALERDDLSQILYSRIPTFAKDMHKANYWLLQTFEEIESQRARSMISKRNSELTQLRTLVEDLDRRISNLNKRVLNSDELNETRLKVGALFEKFDYDARKLLEKKRKLSVLDLLGQSEGNGLRKAELESLWKLGQSVSTDLLQSTKLLEKLMEAEIVSYRDTIRSNRNWTLVLVSTIAILALVLGYYILKNMSIAHESLKSQNLQLAESVRSRLAELELARAKAIEAAAIAEHERNHAIELNDVLQEQTEISNALARKAVAAEKAKSQFLANISHEIRTPMNGVLGMTHLLRESGLSESQLAHIDTLDHCSEALLVLIDDVLDLSKIEAGKLQIEETESDLNEVISATVDLYVPTAHQKRLEMLNFFPLFQKRKLLFDPYRLRQIFSNLISNAIKFTDEGSVRFDADILEEREDKVVVRFSVRDTGLGISSKHQKDLFSPFSQGDGSTTRKFGGTGLGLAISQKLVEMMGSDLEVSSEEGRGSEFSFSLSLKTATSGCSIEERGPNNRGKALVISESPIVSDYLKKAIQYLGLQCDIKERWGEVRKADDYGVIILSENSLYANGGILESNLERSKVIVLHDSWSTVASMPLDYIEGVGWLKRPYDLKSLEALIGDVPLKVSRTTAETPDRKSRFEGINALLVDDNEINLMVAEGLLEKHGIEPFKANRGELALEMCKEKEYEVIFMDCMMPGMDGYQATKAIRSDEDSLNIGTPIIALTANAMKGDREKCLSCGMSDYLSKPLRHEELELVLSRWLGESSANENVTTLQGLDDAKLVDLSEFKKLFEVEDGRSLASFLATFVESLNENLLNLEKAISGDPDFTEVQTISSDIGGSAANFGAEKLNRVADHLERACKDGKSEEAIELIDEMKRLTILTREALLEFTS